MIVVNVDEHWQLRATAPQFPHGKSVLTHDEAKAHLRVNDDRLITALISSETARLDGRDGILKQPAHLGAYGNTT